MPRVPTHNIPITIADILIELSSPLSAAELGIEPRLGPFFGAPERPLARVALRWLEADGALAPPGELIYDPGAIWKMYRAEDETCAALFYQRDDVPAQMRGVLCANPAWDELSLTECPGTAGWRSLLNHGAGELILRAAILFTDGLVFHAAGLDDDGSGIVFVGHAGAGKSTQVGLWGREAGVIPMNDDRIAVRVDGDGAVCYGTPWGGTADVARNHAAPLSAIIILEQAPENHIERLAPAAAASLLSARAFLPYWDPSLMRRAMANLSIMLARVPVYRLRCRPERAVIPLVRSVL